MAYLKQKYGIRKVQKHSDVNATGCPGTYFPFDVIAYGTAAPAPDVQTTKLDMKVRMLKRGMDGADVKTLQAALDRLRVLLRLCRCGRRLRQRHRGGAEEVPDRL